MLSSAARHIASSSSGARSLYSRLHVLPISSLSASARFGLVFLRPFSSVEPPAASSAAAAAAPSTAPTVPTPPPAPETPVIPPVRLGVNISKYGVNLNKLAQEGKLDPVIGRNEQVDRAIQILSRRTKNNPCFIGEPGVGKTAIAEELARRIWVGDVPDWLKDKVIISLDLASMLSGARFRGEFEERLKGVLKDIEQSGDRIILFIDEFHIIVGAGGAEGAIDASNILKPSLSRGQLKCIGATTTNEYRKNIEKDAALTRRFQSVLVPEPTVDETIHIVKGLRSKLESFHNLEVTDDAIEHAVKLSAKYLTEKTFPDKAIDLIDEACSRLRIDLNRTASDIKEMTLEPETKSSLEAQWKEYRAALAKYFEKKKDFEQLNLELVQSEKYGNRDRANYIRNTELNFKSEQIKEATDELNRAVSQLSDSSGTTGLQFRSSGDVPHELHGADIARLITKMTGIPVGTLADSEKKSLLAMEDEMNRRVIGQNEAITAICKCIRLSRAGLRFHDRPLGVFLMLGGTGVGKTEVAKTLCEYLFSDANAMLRIDMSEYMERFSVSRLIGAPPGYVGYEEGGALTESIRRKPYQVILLDEFEKAHKEVSNLLLQVFDEGRLSDSQGRLVDFKNTVIIMTSNLLVDHIKNIPDEANKAAEVRRLVSAHFAPEFVNRLDDIVVFNSLTVDTITSISNIQLKRVESLLSGRGIVVSFTPEAKHWIATSGFDPSFGARPVKRLIQSHILNPIATLILENVVLQGDEIVVDIAGNDSAETFARADFDRIFTSSESPMEIWKRKSLD